MNALVVCTVLLFAGVAHCADTDIHESEKVFESQFKKLYGDAKSEQEAAAALAAAEKEINAQNKLFNEGKATFFEKLNKLSDIPRDVFEKEKEGDFNLNGRAYGDIDIDPSKWYTHPDLERLYESRQAPPASFDATTKGWVTPVKNQLSCGSCAAFAITGAHESCMLRAGARFNGLDLSEQQLLDCGYNKGSMNGCDGADHPSYGVFYADKLKGQSAHEGTYPYLDTSPKLTCPAGLKVYNSGAYVTKALPDYNCDENKLKTLVATYGAAVASIYASDVSLGNYGNVVFNKCTNTSTNHAVLVVGYGTDPTSKLDYWLIRNSWGTNWGANGFFKLQRGNGQCGIGKKCYASDCAKTTGPISDPPIIPPPPPIPASQECDVTALFGVLNGGVYELTYGNNKSRVNCKNGICQPAVAGPSNACMYICGKLACTK